MREGVGLYRSMDALMTVEPNAKLSTSPSEDAIHAASIPSLARLRGSTGVPQALQDRVGAAARRQRSSLRQAAVQRRSRVQGVAVGKTLLIAALWFLILLIFNVIASFPNSLDRSI